MLLSVRKILVLLFFFLLRSHENILIFWESKNKISRLIFEVTILYQFGNDKIETKYLL